MNTTEQKHVDTLEAYIRYLEHEIEYSTEKMGVYDAELSQLKSEVEKESEQPKNMTMEEIHTVFLKDRIKNKESEQPKLSAEEVLRDNMNNYLWKIIESYKDNDDQPYFKNWIIEAMTEFAEQFKNK